MELNHTHSSGCYTDNPGWASKKLTCGRIQYQLDTHLCGCGDELCIYGGTVNDINLEKEKPVELKITDDKVKAAAESCPDAKRVLTALFPDVFNKVYTHVEMDRQTEQALKGRIQFFDPNYLDNRAKLNVEVRNGGNLTESIYLPPVKGHKWVLENEGSSILCLVLRNLLDPKIAGKGQL